MYNKSAIDFLSEANRVLSLNAVSVLSFCKLGKRLPQRFDINNGDSWEYLDFDSTTEWAEELSSRIVDLLVKSIPSTSMYYFQRVFITPLNVMGFVAVNLSLELEFDGEFRNHFRSGRFKIVTPYQIPQTIVKLLYNEYMSFYEGLLNCTIDQKIKINILHKLPIEWERE